MVFAALGAVGRALAAGWPGARGARGHRAAQYFGGPSENRFAREHAVGSLTQGSAQELPLSLALQDRSPDVRLSAVQLVDARDGERSVEVLMTALRDEYWQVASAAARALVRSGGPVVTAALERAVHDPDGNVRFFARRSLLELTSLGNDAVRHRGDLLGPALRAPSLQSAVTGGSCPLLPAWTLSVQDVWGGGR